MPLLLCGCGLQFHLTNALWEPDNTIAPVDRQQAKLAVGAVSVCRDDGTETENGPTTRVLLRTQRHGGRPTRALQPELGGPRWFSLAWPEDPLTARAMGDLFATEPIGGIEHCAIDVSWTLTVQGERNWEGYVEARGQLSPELRRSELDEAAALALLASPAVVPAGAGDENLQRCIAAAERVDWCILLPNAADGSGRVIGCLKSQAGVAAGYAGAVDLVVRTGREAPHRYLRVPAAAMPVLALAWRDPRTLFDRFVVQTWCQVRLATEPPAGAPRLAPTWSTTFRLSSGGEALHRYDSPALNAILTPFAVMADVAVWFLKQGPFQFLVPTPDRGPPPRRDR